MHDAVARADRETVTRLIEAGAPVNQTIPFPTDTLVGPGRSTDALSMADATPLLVAIAARSRPMVEVLLANDADLHSPTNLGLTPLLLAALRGDAELVGVLLAAGADPDTMHPVAAELLLGSGLGPDLGVEPGTSVECAPIHAATRSGNGTIIAALGRTEADLDARFNGAFTALMLAAFGNRLEAANALLAAGADPNLTDDTGTTALHIAIYENHVALARLLIERGADVRATDEAGQSVLRAAVAKNNTEIAALVVARGASLEQRTEDGRTLLHAAAEHGQRAMVAWLIERGLAPSATDIAGTTPGALAAQNGHEAIAALLGPAVR